MFERSMIRQIAPQFFTTEMAATLAYYKDALGFDCAGTWDDPPVYAIVARDEHRIHFRLADPPTPNPDKYADERLDAYLFIENADALYAEYAARGVEFNALYFDMSKAVTLEGEVLRVEWINPHVLLFLQSKNEKGEPETWILQGSSLNNALRQVGAMKDRLKPGTSISARVWPARNPLFLNDVQTVLLARRDDARKSSRIAGGGQIRFSNGDVLAIGGGPRF